MNTRRLTAGLALLLITVAFAAMAYAQSAPIGAESVTLIRSERINESAYSPSTENAEAGNLTELTISGVSETKSWQGYFGNVTGTLILEDASGDRFYDWGAAEPQGEIFASVNSSITWTTVTCAPLGNASYISAWNANYGMNSADDDSINITFNRTDHPEFYVGYETFTSGACRNTYTFVNGAAQATDFAEVVLSSDNNGTLIFTALIENSTIGERSGIPGYDGGNYDFQMLVAEEGKGGDTALTQYYFWVELE